MPSSSHERGPRRPQRFDLPEERLRRRLELGFWAVGEVAKLIMRLGFMVYVLICLAHGRLPGADAVGNIVKIIMQ